MRFKDRHIQVTGRPTIIIGERPGRQRLRDQNGLVFHGNRTGDFVEEWIKDRTNIVLTNIQQVYYPGRARFKGTEHSNGIISLHNLVARMRPKHVVCLGQYAAKCLVMISCLPEDCKVTSLPHPSYVLRFNKTELIQLYNEALQHN